MPDPHKQLTEEQKRALSALSKPAPEFEPKSAEQIAAEQKAAAEKMAAAIAHAKIGETIEGQGVFFGKYVFKNGGISKTFNLFAAPEDLANEAGIKSTFTYVDAVKRIAALKNWHGFDGAPYENDIELYRALKSGSYQGGWIIPTYKMLIGKDVVAGGETQPDNLFKYKDRGDLKGTFSMVFGASNGDSHSSWYWSCTEDLLRRSCVWEASFVEGMGGSVFKNSIPLSCRPVRLVPAPSMS